MRRIEELKELQNLLFDLIVKFDSYCNGHGLRYALSGGSCIGAIRHQGFIPWDDDIDLVMPRPDYMKLLELTKTEEISSNTRLMYMDREPYYEYPFIKITNTDTVLIEHHYKEFPMGVFLDVFPLDGVPENPEDQEKLYKKINHCRNMLCGSFGQYEKRGTGFWDYTLGCIGTFFLHRVYHLDRRHYIKKMDRIASSIPYDESDHVGCVIWSVGWKRENNRKEVFFPTERKALFNGKELYIPADAETYLTKMYGNYMSLPPENERIQHDFEAYTKLD